MDYFDEFLEEVREAKSMADADYLLGKVAELDKQIDEIDESADIQMQRIREWQESRIASIEKQKQYFLPSLHAYILSTEKKTVKLVNGVLSIRKRQPKLEIIDEEIIPNQFINVKEVSSIDKSGIKAHIKSTGEIPEGVDYIQQDDKFGYKVSN